MQPARHRRDSGIAAVMLMDAQIDHVTGLLMLREGKTLPLYCTAPVWRELNGALPLVPVLSHYCGVRWHELPVEGSLQIPGIAGIRFTPLALSSKAPPYSDHREHPHTGDNIGLLIEDVATGKSAFYAPGLGAIDPQVEAALRQADCVLVDGTFWHADEMIELGLSSKTAADMGHLPQSGEGGMIAVLDGVNARRKVLIHINNTNPILDEDAEQRAVLARHGIDVAFDGMEITL
jgi:pyrroloquinoline quinone biosynthesis protein B